MSIINVVAAEYQISTRGDWNGMAVVVRINNVKNCMIVCLFRACTNSEYIVSGYNCTMRDRFSKWLQCC